MFIMGKSKTYISMELLISFLLFASVGCSNKDCNFVAVTFSGHVLMNKDALVIIDGGIGGHVEDINYESSVTRIKLCLLDSSAISRNSTVEAGFVPLYGGRCVLITPSIDSQFLANDEMLQGVEKDTLHIGFPSESEAGDGLKKRALEILKEQNRKDSLKHQDR
jgi:hypothetical protein